MKEELISKFTSLLAKRKGFDIPVTNYFKMRGMSDPILEEEQDVPQNLNTFESLFSRPTQSLLQRWLKDKHNIFVNADISPTNGNFEWFIHDLNVSLEDAQNNKFVKLLEESEGFDYITYEEALEAGLKRSLEIIK